MDTMKTTNKLFFAILTLAAAFMIAGCGGGSDKPGTVAVSGVSLNKPSLTMTVGGTETLTAAVAPANATNKAVNWSSSANDVATVDSNGKVTAVAPGPATITATTADGGKTAMCNVTVNAAHQAVTGVSLNKTSLTLTVGDTETLTATVAPANATNTSVNWSSSSDSVATVDANGKVTAVTPGSATIIATTVDGGKTATCNLTVEAPGIDSDGGADEWGDGGKINL